MIEKDKAALREASPYNTAITREQFLFYEMRTTAKLVSEGLTEDLEYTCKKLYSQAFQQGVKMRNLKHSKGGGSRGFIVFTQTAGVVEPARRAFDNPTPRQDFPFVRLTFFGDFHAHEQSSVHFMNKCSAIAVARAEFLNGWPTLKGLYRRVNAGNRVMNVRGVNDNAKNIPQRIGYDMPFSSFRFSPVKSALLSRADGFHALRIDDCVSGVFVPSRVFSRDNHKALHDSVPQTAQTGAAIKTVYGGIRREIMR